MFDWRMYLKRQVGHAIFKSFLVFFNDFQFIVGEQGINGLTYEHSPAEGQPIAVLTDYILGYIKKNPQLTDSSAVGKREQPTGLKFNVTGKVQELIESAGKNINR